MTAIMSGFLVPLHANIYLRQAAKEEAEGAGVMGRT